MYITGPLAVAFWAAQLHAEECANRPLAAALEAHLAVAEGALRAADAANFELAMEEIALVLPCLADTPTPAVAARLHRIIGIQAFVRGDAERARQAFSAARVLEPDYTFPSQLYAPENDIRQMYDSMDATATASTRVPEPRDGSLVFDGTATRSRPRDRATVVQLVSENAQVASTTYVLPTQPLPPYRAIPRTRNTLFVTAGVSLLGAVATYAGAWVSRGEFERDDPSYTLDDLERLQAQTSAFLVVSGVLGATAAGTGLGALAVGER